MQTPVAANEPGSQALAQVEGAQLPWYRRRKVVYAIIGAQLLIVLAVSAVVFRGMLIQGGEEDARLALKRIGTELAKTETLPQMGLAQWMAGQKTLRHRMGDARLSGMDVHFHGYRIEFEPSEVGGTLWAHPLQPGQTGNTVYHLEVQR